MTNETATTVEPTTYAIPVCNLGELKEKLAKLNKLATKLGCEPVGYTELARRTEVLMRTNEDGSQTRIEREIADITVTGTAPKLAGWEFIGRIELVEGLTFFYSAPGKNIPQEHRDAPHHCDHCGTERARRNTYIVSNETGAKRVGSNCLKDFLGHKSPDAIARFLELIREFLRGAREDYGTQGWSDPLFPLADLLPQIAAVIRVKGWVTKSMAQKAYDNGWRVPDTTAGNLVYILNPYNTASGWSKEEQQKRAELIESCKVTDADNVTEQVKAFIAARPDDGTDFTFNLKQLLKLERAPTKQWGIIVAAVGMYLKEQGRLAERAKRVSEFVPGVAVGERVTLKLLLSKVIVIPGYQFGDKYLHSFLDDAGRAVVWFSSAGKVANEGETVTVKATVKKMEEYKGLKQTVLTRAKLLENHSVSKEVA
jgi:hypothetical protein